VEDFEGVDEMGVEVPDASPVTIKVEGTRQRLELVAPRHVHLAQSRRDAGDTGRPAEQARDARQAYITASHDTQTMLISFQPVNHIFTRKLARMCAHERAHIRLPISAEQLHSTDEIHWMAGGYILPLSLQGTGRRCSSHDTHEPIRAKLTCALGAGVKKERLGCAQPAGSRLHERGMLRQLRLRCSVMAERRGCGMARVKVCLRAGEAPALGEPLVSAGLRLKFEVKLHGLLVERLRIRDILLVYCVDNVSVVAPALSAPAHSRILVPLFLTPSMGVLKQQ
jgi:hypothetical protein